MKILLMNGHGGNPYDSGAVGNGYKEAELTRELADLVETKLKKYATVVRYPKDRNAYADVQNGTFANYVSGGIKNINYAFEIHFNAGGGTGTEIYITTKEEGHTVEDAIVKNIANAIGVRNRGVKVTDFSVIATCKYYGVSSALLETLFIDSASDMKLWASNKDKIAEAIVDGIATGFGLKSKTSDNTTESKPEEKPTEAKKTNEQIADEVIAGKWGNGETRKKALEDAGYNYDTIQNLVNKKLGATTTTANTKKTVSQLANEVIAGKWGTGNTRKQKLEAAGYNYDAVQAEVNKKLGVSTSSKKSVTSQVVNDVINGKYGNGTARKTALEKAGYDYEEVQAAVNKALS